MANSCQNTLLPTAHVSSFAHLKMVEVIPKLIVFDLDYTLWPFWIDTHVNPPFRKSKSNVVDSTNSKIKYYPEVPNVLKKLHDVGFILGIASRTSEINGAHQLVELLGWDKYFTYKEIYPGCKVTHFNKFKHQSGIEFKDMIFFDDEHRNIRDLNQVGVFSVLVNNGVTWDIVENGLKEYASRYK